jgi:hypothetical protein
MLRLNLHSRFIYAMLIALLFALMYFNYTLRVSGTSFSIPSYYRVNSDTTIWVIKPINQ